MEYTTDTYVLHSQIIMCQNNIIKTVRVSTRKLEKCQNYGCLHNLNLACMCICIMAVNGTTTSFFSQVPSLSQCPEQVMRRYWLAFQHIICSLHSLHTLMVLLHSKNETRFHNAALMARGLRPRWSLRFLPSQTMLWFSDSAVPVTVVAAGIKQTAQSL